MSLFRNVGSVSAVPKATTTVPIAMTDFGDNLAAGDTRTRDRGHCVNGLRFKHSRSSRSITSWGSSSSRDGAATAIKPSGYLGS
jgi:hypothetical protein